MLRLHAGKRYVLDSDRLRHPTWRNHQVPNPQVRAIRARGVPAVVSFGLTTLFSFGDGAIKSRRLRNERSRTCPGQDWWAAAPGPPLLFGLGRGWNRWRPRSPEPAHRECAMQNGVSSPKTNVRLRAAT